MGLFGFRSARKKAEEAARKAEAERLAAEAALADAERRAAEAQAALAEAEAKRIEAEKIAAEAKRAAEEQKAAEAKRAESQQMITETDVAKAERLAAEAERLAEEAVRAAVNTPADSGIHKSTELIRKHFESKGYNGVRVEVEGSVSVVRLHFAGNVAPVREYFFFSSDDSNDVSIRSTPIAVVPEEKTSAILKYINNFHLKIRFAKLQLCDNNELQMQADILKSTGDDAVGPIANEYLMRTLNILDLIYPEIMEILKS